MRFLAGTLLVVAANACVMGQSPDSASPNPPTSAPATVSADNAATFMLPADLHSAVEKEVGRSFTRKPEIVVAGRSEIEQAALRDAHARLAAAGRPQDAPPSAVADVFAHYSIADRAIYVDPAARASAIESPAIRQRVVTIAILAELVRAMQDQELGLLSYLPATFDGEASLTDDELHRRRALSEGQAFAVALRIAEAMAKDDPLLAEAATAARTLALGKLPSAQDTTLYRETIVHRGGLGRVGGILAKDGVEATWALFASTPPALNVFEGAVTVYDSALSTRMATALQAHLKTLGPNWGGQGIPETPARGFTTQLARMTDERRLRYLNSVEGMASLLASGPNNMRIMLSVTKATDDASADFVWKELEVMNADAIAKMPAKEPEREQVDGDEVESDAVRILIPRGASGIPGTLSRARHGQWLLQMSYLSAKPEMSEVRRIMSEVLRSMPAATSGSVATPSDVSAPASPPTAPSGAP